MQTLRLHSRAAASEISVHGAQDSEFEQCLQVTFMWPCCIGMVTVGVKLQCDSAEGMSRGKEIGFQIDRRIPREGFPWWLSW